MRFNGDYNSLSGSLKAWHRKWPTSRWFTTTERKHWFFFHDYVRLPESRCHLISFWSKKWGSNQKGRFKQINLSAHGQIPWQSEEPSKSHTYWSTALQPPAISIQGFPKHAGLKVAVLKVLSAADVQNEAATAITQEIIHLRTSENDRDRWWYWWRPKGPMFSK